MRQAVLVEPKHIEFREVEAPKASDLKEHQVLLNIKRIGICGSEIHSYHGCHPATFYPVVQGHEYSAVVVATGAAVTICKAGDVVTARPQLACGKCKPCQRGEYNICEELRVQAFQANGAAQDFFVVDDDRVAVLPEGMSLDYGAMIEPVAVAAHATMRGGDLKGKNVVVSGAGTIGNLVAQFAKARGAKRVLITDVSDFRLEIARKCGIIDTLNVAKTPLKEGAKRLFGDEDFQAAFEVAGVESSIRSLMECIEKGSTIVVVAVFGKDPSLNMFYLGEHELKVNGTMMYLHEDYLLAELLGYLLHADLVVLPGFDHLVSACSALFFHRIICRCANVVQCVEPGNVLFLAVVCVIDQRAAINLTNLCDKLTPLLLLVLGAYHLAADAQHFAACVFGYLRIMADECSIA